MEKMPFIANKKLYAATMGACRWIAREHNVFHRACKFYAEKYDVPALAVEEEVKKRQAVGRANKAKYNRGYTMKWYAVEFSMGSSTVKNDFFTPEDARYVVCLGRSLKSMEKRFYDEYPKEGDWEAFLGRKKEFATREEAEAQCKEWHGEQRRNWSLYNMVGKIQRMIWTKKEEAV